MTDKKQPEALSLARELDLLAPLQDARYPNFSAIVTESAAQLRRLHAESENLHASCNGMREDRDRYFTRYGQACEASARRLNEIATLEAQLSAIGAGGVEQLRKRDGQQPQAWLVYLPSCDAQNVYDSRDDIGYIDDLTNNDDAVVTPLYATLQAEPTQAYSIDADPQGIRAYVADAITGALACGAQGTGTPPPDHWLTPFWRQARFGQIQYNALRDATDALLNAPGAAQEHATQLAGQGAMEVKTRPIIVQGVNVGEFESWTPATPAAPIQEQEGARDEQERHAAWVEDTDAAIAAREGGA